MVRTIICRTDNPLELELRERIIGNADVIAMSPPQPTFGVAWDAMHNDMKELSDLLHSEGIYS